MISNLKSLVLVSLALVGVAACTLDDKKIEASITSEFKSKGVEIKSIDCPSNRPLKSGDQFDCTVTDSDGDELTINVTQTDGSGTIKWALDGRILAASQLGDSLEESIGKGVDVKCPDKPMILVKGKKFSCKASKGDDDGTIDIVVKDNEGNVSWKLKPKA